jgi:2-keto-4-pentenoate hydratase/2-oxohepta-3-ene-1,7-dioic acid hydratase in catechol pathway
MLWMRFSRQRGIEVGILDGDNVQVCSGDPFSGGKPTGEALPASEIQWETPCVPSKMIALWNNFHAAATKFALGVPPDPLFFLKGANSYCAHGSVIAAPRSYRGRVLFEGELGVVIGKAGKDIAVADAPAYIFGYTCVNDVTAVDLLKADPSLPQWTRAKGFDAFGPFGPVIATDLDPARLTVRTLVNGRERQSYPVSDMIFSPAELVSLISRDMTLFPGDVISCGTSVGAGPIPSGATVEVHIQGIGTLSNRYQ